MDIDLDVIYLLDFARLLLLRIFFVSIAANNYFILFLLSLFESRAYTQFTPYTTCTFSYLLRCVTLCTVRTQSNLCDRISNQVHSNVRTHVQWTRLTQNKMANVKWYLLADHIRQDNSHLNAKLRESFVPSTPTKFNVDFFMDQLELCVRSEQQIENILFVEKISKKILWTNGVVHIKFSTSPFIIYLFSLIVGTQHRATVSLLRLTRLTISIIICCIISHNYELVRCLLRLGPSVKRKPQNVPMICCDRCETCAKKQTNDDTIAIGFIENCVVAINCNSFENTDSFVEELIPFAFIAAIGSTRANKVKSVFRWAISRCIMSSMAHNATLASHGKWSGIYWRRKRIHKWKCSLSLNGERKCWQNKSVTNTLNE